MESSALHVERMTRFEEAALYYVTSEPLSRGRSTLEVLKAALDGGVRLVQLREKTFTRHALTALAESARALTQEYNALLLINDYVDIALAVDADGVHLGTEDLPIDAARRIAPDMIVGASSHTPEQFEHAQGAGASYVNIGPIFATKTKHWEGKFLGVSRMQQIAEVARVPFTVMGGIKAKDVPELVTAGARTIALVTAVSAADSPQAAARDLLDLIEAQRRRVS